MQILDLKEEPQHLLTLAEWHHAQWAHLNPGQTLEARIQKMKSCLGDDFIPTSFVARDGRLAGSAAVVAHDMDSRPELTPWLASVFVAPEERKKGIGAELVKHAMRQAKAAGIRTLYLFTPDQEAFYRKLGWSVFEKATYYGESVTIMHVTLNEQ